LENKVLHTTLHKNNREILCLTKGRFKFTSSDLPEKNPRTQTRYHP